jgi:threonine/homoserine/homoserine lactone efflux protein
MNSTKELVVAWIRTSLVPPTAGLILTWLANRGITSIEESWVFAVTTLVLSGVWYLLFRAIEIWSQNPRIRRIAGIFLGYPARPTYLEE